MKWYANDMPNSLDIVLEKSSLAAKESRTLRRAPGSAM
jgi:hypothetical protein